jgi:hypothetical protein
MTMTSDQPSRVTPADISQLLSAAHKLSLHAPLGEQIAYFERKAELLSRIAADMDTPEAHAAAAEASDQLASPSPPSSARKCRERARGHSNPIAPSLSRPATAEALRH